MRQGVTVKRTIILILGVPMLGPSLGPETFFPTLNLQVGGRF